MLILGIETSCDETAAAVIEEKNGRFSVLSNIVSSQIKIHAPWGGVVPNLAAREHLKNILPVIETSLKEAGISIDDIDLVSLTSGPGLIPALLIGVNTARTVAFVFNKPLIGVHHIEGHIYASLLESSKKSNNYRILNEIDFPALALVISGGHTQLVLMKKHLSYEIIGTTLDDAAGEAFDKVARILGFSYPGGPIIADWAEKFQKTSFTDIKLPRPMINAKNLDFSFSGLKTAVLYTIKKNPEILKNNGRLSQISHEFQQAVSDVLISKTVKAAQKYGPKTIILAGGVSANKEIRKQLGEAIAQKLPGIKYLIPDIKYSVDNAAMIAVAGYFRWKNETNKNKFKNSWKSINADANLKLK
ncbi:MAG TPA: tRNA (adenosine(37)-N6)-threonylcarbamoyltransferase complex transferase subunit TsaD [Candidatus Moranbacteria bacterium]|nr:tRNA (adenosine(37)-N6)-threonylcarbamoyltransferase complex transferase subunit TsaD [Candidatus Moranbacteria bacterium]